MAASDSLKVPKKNVAFRWSGEMRDNTGSLVGGLTTLSAIVSKDNATPAVASNSPVEIAATGLIYLDITSTEMNADSVVLKFTAANPNTKESTAFLYLAGTLGTVDGVTGTVGGTVAGVTGTVAGAVGSVTGAVGSVTGAVASVTGNVGGNVVGTVSQVTGTVGTIGGGGLTAAAVSAGAVSAIQSGLATPTNITAGTITTVTNLTNAPTSGDLTATMKTSVTTAATAATPIAASVTGTVGTIGAGGITAAAVSAGAVSAIQSGLATPTNITAGTLTGVGLVVAATAAERNAIADALLDRSNGVETGTTPRQALRLIGAACAGVFTNDSGTQVTISGLGVATTRIVATVASSAVAVNANLMDRTALTLTP